MAGKRNQYESAYFFIGNPNIKIQDPSIHPSSVNIHMKKCDERTSKRINVGTNEWTGQNQSVPPTFVGGVIKRSVLNWIIESNWCILS